MASKQRCIKCGASLSAGAEFCHACGTSQMVSGGGAIPLPWLFGGFAVVVIAVAAFSYTLGRSAGERAATGGVPPGMVGGSPLAAPDISAMTPRQQADRLYDMVMTAHEQGDQGRMAQFAPMALQAYATLGPLDPDAHFHVGLISVFTGNIDEGLARADSIDQAVAGHLFAPILRFNAAMLQSDPESAQEAQRRFIEHYDRQIATLREEYQLHQRQVEAFRARAVEEVGGGT